MEKITFVGDIMCEPILINIAKRKGYDFNEVFCNVKELFNSASYVVGNLESPLAGKKMSYSHELFSFNAPDEFADAIKAAGINMVTTANNHCLDRGIYGLKRTIEILKEKGISHTGTYLQQSDRTEAEYIRLNNLTIAIVAYTYGTNYLKNKIVLDEQQAGMVNLLRPQQERYYTINKEKKPIALRIINRILRLLRKEHQCYIRKALHMEYNQPRKDDYLNKNTIVPYVEKMKADIIAAKMKADLVFFFPHLGGQFNDEPGVFSDYIFDKAIEAGCDAIIASHPHIVQKACKKNDIPCFYSIGNFSMSPNSVYLLHEHLPEYGLAVHFYIEDKRIEKISFSILYIVENKNKMLTVYPVNQYMKILSNYEDKHKLKDNVMQIYKTVVGQVLEEPIIRNEYCIDWRI